jgi:hypothetical protein
VILISIPPKAAGLVMMKFECLKSLFFRAITFHIVA